MGIDLAILGLAAFAAGFVSSFAGFGYAAVAALAVTHVLGPVEAAALMMLCSVLVQAAGAMQLRATLCLREAAPYCVAGLAGVALALPVLPRLDAAAFRTLFGAILVAHGAATLLAPQRAPGAMAPPGPFQRGGLGAAGGAVGALTAMPSVPLVVWSTRRGEDKARLRGVLQPFILTMQLAALTGMAASGLLRPADVASPLAASLPGLAAGYVLGLRLYRRCDAANYRRRILVLLTCAGAAMVWA